MRVMISLVACLLLAAQDDPARRARELVEKLRSDEIDVREKAAEQLKALGKAAKAEVEKAARDSDAEVSLLARSVLRSIEIKECVTPGVAAARPSFIARLEKGEDSAWAVGFREALSLILSGRGRLTRADLEPLAEPALRHSPTVGDKRGLCDLIGRYRLSAAVPELLNLLKDENLGLRRDAACSLAEIGTPAALSGVAGLLDAPDAETRELAVRLLLGTRCKDLISHLIRMLRDGSKPVRERALRGLEDLSQGPPEEPFTQEAKAALKRAARRDY